ncbi:MAG: acyl-CoA thioesterase [Gammaproteobacteria bacterium]|nr:acyl-CoA thioesterase [Gammaproteobacteria bacterium]
MSEPSETGDLTLRTTAMPADTNPNGDIFGGWVMAQMDLAGGAAAIKRARGRVATVAVDGMTFHRPVYVGDQFSVYTRIARVGRTSITVRVEAWVCRGIGGEPFRVTEGQFVYVAVDGDGRPRAVAG